jgi:acyl-[acyl carrier protein]--UDP-N-acetylglucosamine O-acyltransferase
MTVATVEKIQSLMEVIDLNKENIPEKDYLQVCNILKDIYNDYEGRQNDDNDIEIQYNNSEFVKHIVSLLVIVTNIANFILVFLLFDNVKKVIN